MACVAVTFPEDTDLLPAGVVGAPNLERVVTDVGSFALPRPLPLIFDILRNGTLAPVSWPDVKDEVEFIVLTNSDIHLQPTFYCVLGEFIKQGFDVVTVNRRTLDVAENDRGFSPLFWGGRRTGTSRI